ncbi:MAG: hypothetical protein QOH61_2158 [Chloroflexota bacterium]|jgi:hypothetical protein|nr:hypothetical protein [Chloroflexota bacterium]
MATPTEEARRKVIEAREALGGELDELTSAARSAVDIPAKIRKKPLETVAVAAGAGFLIVGGPKRVLKSAMSRVRPQRRRPHEGLLPKEIDKVVKKKAGPYAPEIEGALEEDFAQYLKKKGEVQKNEPTAGRSLLKTYDAMLAPLGVVVAKQLTDRLFQADKDRPPASGGADASSGSGSGNDAVAKGRRGDPGPRREDQPAADGGRFGAFRSRRRG